MYMHDIRRIRSKMPKALLGLSLQSPKVYGRFPTNTIPLALYKGKVDSLVQIRVYICRWTALDTVEVEFKTEEDNGRYPVRDSYSCALGHVSDKEYLDDLLLFIVTSVSNFGILPPVKAISLGFVE